MRRFWGERDILNLIHHQSWRRFFLLFWHSPSIKMSSDSANDDSLYPIAVLIDELRNEDVQVRPCLASSPSPRFLVKQPLWCVSETIFNSFPASPELHQEVVDHRACPRSRADSLRAHSLPDGHHLRRGRGASGSGRATGNFHPARRRSPVRSLPPPALGVSGHSRGNHRQRQSKKWFILKAWNERRGRN